MSNVVVMDFVYGVNSVTIWAVHLLLMAVLLVIPDVRRLLNVLVWNRATAPREIGPVNAGRWSRPARITVKTLAIFYVAWQLFNAWTRLHTTGDLAPKPPLYGTYDVEQFVRNGDSTPPRITDTTQWRRLIVIQPYEMAPVILQVRRPNDSQRQYDVRIDTLARQLTILPRPNRGATTATNGPPNPVPIGTFAYAAADSGRVVMTER